MAAALDRNADYRRVSRSRRIGVGLEQRRAGQG